MSGHRVKPVPYDPQSGKCGHNVDTKSRKQFRLDNVRDVLIQHGYSPAAATLRIAIQAEAESGDEGYEPSVRRAFLDMALKANTELLQYIEPKLSRTEVTGRDGGPIEALLTSVQGATLPVIASVDDNEN